MRRNTRAILLGLLLWAALLGTSLAAYHHYSLGRYPRRTTMRNTGTIEPNAAKPHYIEKAIRGVTIQDAPPLPCRDGYVNRHGICFETCPAGYRDLGMVCAKNFAPYQPPPGKPCRAGHWQQGGLCLEPCADRGCRFRRNTYAPIKGGP